MKRVAWAARSAVAALLMTGTVLALTAPAIASADARSASLWSRLWRTPDQRGQALLQQGDAAGAAQAFVDPQHKAHAALQAHDYTAAAQTLTGIDTAEAHYNRGNALAHTGDLQDAIRAYDAALKLNPQHTDARHNRDVVAAALQKQKESKKDESKQDKQQQSNEDRKPGDKADGKQDAKDGKSDAKPSDKADGKQGSKDGKSDGKPSDKADGKHDAKDGKSDATPSDKSDGKNDGKSESKPSDKSAGKQDGNDGKPADKTNDNSGSKPGEKTGQKRPDQSNPPASAKPGERPAFAPQSAIAAVSTTAATNPKDDAAQARHDAESALGKGAQPAVPTQNGASAASQGRPGTADAARVPLTEKQIAQEQWLRAIPDDAGGLLRRKFLIEHLLRQQGQKP